jgi:hypothetical protein
VGPGALVNGLDDALTHLKRLKAAGAISVKSYMQPRREQRQQILEAARQTGMMVVPEGGSLFQMNMSMVVDGHTGIEHALPVARSLRRRGSSCGRRPGRLHTDARRGLRWPRRRALLVRDDRRLDPPDPQRFVPRSVLQSRAVRRETAPVEDYNVLRVAQNATALQRPAST